MSLARTGGAGAAPVYVLTLSCSDRIGIVADVARFLVENACNILESAQHGDADNDRFFLRTVFESTQGRGLDELTRAFSPVAAKYAMEAGFFDASVRTPTLILVSRHGHCLNDLLFRWRTGALPIELKAIVSNHRDFEDLAAAFGLPFHFLPVTPETKAASGSALLEASLPARDRADRAGALHADPVGRALRRHLRADASTSTTRSCRASRAPGRTTRRTRAA